MQMITLEVKQCKHAFLNSLFLFFLSLWKYTPTNKVFGAFRNPLVCTSVCTILSRKSAKFLPDPYFYFGGAFFPTKIAYMYDFRACHNFVPRSFEQVQGHWNEKYKFVSVLYFLIEYDCFILHHKKIAYDLCHEMCNFNVIV